MNLVTASAAQRQDVERRILKGYGEKFTVEWTDLREVTEEVTGEDGKSRKVKVLKPVKATNTYYIGKMTPGQTGGVMSILAAVFMNAEETKEAEGRTDNLPFLEYLDDFHLTMLMTIILGEEQTWVSENWDLDGWVMDALDVFLRYNNFFNLIRKLGKTVQNMGVTEGQAKAVLAGQTP